MCASRHVASGIAVLTAFVALIVLLARPAAADWPTLAGSNGRSGLPDDGDVQLKAPGVVRWAVAFDGERVGTAVEPIVVGKRVFVPTHAGGVWALDAETGKPLWRFAAAGPVLHSPTYYQGWLYVADAGGCLHALDPRSGKPRWSRAFPGESFAASPCAFWAHRDKQLVAIGGRSGTVRCVEADTGDDRWERPLGAPIRQTTAEEGDRVLYVTAEDMRLRMIDVADGAVKWETRPLAGQSARDYYPVLASSGKDGAVVVRTAPSRQFSRRLNADARMLTAAAGIDGSDWKSVAAWTKNGPKNLGTPELWEKERQAVLGHLAADPAAATFHALDADTGKPLPLKPGRDPLLVPPILWAGGCQGVPAPPAVLPDDRLVVEYRTAYGNWNHGVAPLVGVGLYDLGRNAVDHVDHANGTPDAPWNTYWGTADEAKHFQVVGDTVVITHQGTLCLFDLKTRKLAAIQGERDTFGGYKQGLPWARNEWHGPARGGAAVVGNSLFWISGSRVFRVDCIGAKRPLPETVVLKRQDAPATAAATAPADARDVVAAKGLLRFALDRQVQELIGKEWAPFACVPGLAGPERSATHSGEVIEALAEAYPHLGADRHDAVRAYVAKLVAANPPLDPAGMAFDPARGERREDAAVDPAAIKPRDDDPKLHPFGNVHAVRRWAERAGDAKLLADQWPAARAAFDSFAASKWKLDPAKGDLYANRYLASLLAYAEWAKANNNDAASAGRATAMADETAKSLAAWWKRAAVEQRAMAGVEGIAQLDGFIGTGGGVFLRLVPHRHKLALFRDLTPGVLAAVRRHEPDAPGRAWDAFAAVAPTWYLTGEERQVHYGENMYDPPDFAAAALRASAVVGGASPADLVRFADRPWGRADVTFVLKAGLTLDRP